MELHMTATYAEKTKKGAVEFYNDKGVLVETHSGGSLSWKDNNPGNIVYAHQHSAVGSYHASTGYTFAIFPTYEAGVAAAVHNLKSGIGNYLVDVARDTCYRSFS
jgi:hypothetical protein